MYKKESLIISGKFFLLSCIATSFMVLPKINKHIHNCLEIKYSLNTQFNDLPDTNSLKIALLNYMEDVDSGKYEKIIPFYDSAFLSIRVVDAGEFIKMDYKQMVYFWNMQIKKQTTKSFDHHSITTQKTTIHYMEILGDTGYVLLARIKNLGNGLEPMFYTLIWINKNDRWYLFREIVHQRSMPAFH